MNNYIMQFNYLEHEGNENSGRFRRGSGKRPYQHGGLFSRFRKGGASIKTNKKISKGTPQNKNRGHTNNQHNQHNQQNQRKKPNKIPGYDDRRPGENYKKSEKEVSKMSDRELNDHVQRLRKQKEAKQISNYLLDKHAHDKPKPDSIFVKAGKQVGEKALRGAGSYGLKALTQGQFDRFELGEAMFYGGPGGKTKKKVKIPVKKNVNSSKK